MKPHDFLNCCRIWQFELIAAVAMLVVIIALIADLVRKRQKDDPGEIIVITVSHVESISIHNYKHRP